MFFTPRSLGRHADPVLPVADENMKPAVTSLAAAAATAADDDAGQPLTQASSCSDHVQTFPIINRSINLLPRIRSTLNYERC